MRAAVDPQLSDANQPHAFVAGVVVFAGWKLVHGPAHHMDILTLAEARNGHNTRRAGQRFFEQENIFSAIVCDGVGGVAPAHLGLVG